MRNARLLGEKSEREAHLSLVANVTSSFLRQRSFRGHGDVQLTRLTWFSEISEAAMMVKEDDWLGLSGPRPSYTTLRNISMVYIMLYIERDSGFNKLCCVSDPRMSFVEAYQFGPLTAPLVPL